MKKSQKKKNQKQKKKMEVEKCALVARVSTQKQTQGISMEAQLQQLTEFAASKGYQVVRKFRLQESGRGAQRPQLEGVMQFARDNAGTRICFTDVDRVGRHVATNQKVIDLPNELDIFEIPGFSKANPEHRFLLTLNTGLGSWESDRISARTRRCMTAQKKTGKTRAGKNWKKQQSKANKTKTRRNAAVDKRVAPKAKQMAKQGRTKSSMVGELNEMGLLNGSKKWTPQTFGRRF